MADLLLSKFVANSSKLQGERAARAAADYRTGLQIRRKNFTDHVWADRHLLKD